jgi:hypothetical protein
MKYQRGFYGGSLVKAILLLLLVSSVEAQDEMTVDFSQSREWGKEFNKIRIDNIIVRVTIVDPLNPKERQEIPLKYDLDFKACRLEQGELYLTPILGEEPPCPPEIGEVNFSNTRGFSRGTDRVQINHIGGIPATVFRFELSSLKLLQTAEPVIPPDGVFISLKWSNDKYDLDAHFTGPSTPHSEDRFHVYFSNKSFQDMAWLKNDDGEPFESQEEEVRLLPPLVAEEGGFVRARTLMPGRYRFAVHLFQGDGNFNEAGVEVRVWLGREPERVFLSPLNPDNSNPKMSGWIVFEFYVADDGMVTIWPMQYYLDVVSPHEIRRGQR